MKKRIIISLVIILALSMITGTALAAGAFQLYDFSTTHRYDAGSLYLSGTSWTGGSDDNDSISFSKPGLQLYQKSTVVTSSGIAMSGTENVPSGGTRTFSLYSAYLTTPYVYCRIANPYYGTSDACTMSTEGTFGMTFV